MKKDRKTYTTANNITGQNNDINPTDEQNIIEMLDDFASTDSLRMKVKMTNEGKPGQIKKGFIPGHLDNINTTIGSRNKVEFTHFKVD